MGDNIGKKSFSEKRLNTDSYQSFLDALGTPVYGYSVFILVIFNVCNVREVKIVRKVCLTDALNRRLSSHQELNALNY